MKQVSLFIFFLNFLVISSIAQSLKNEIPSFGKIDISDLKITDCSFEPGAAAINLLRYEEVTLTVFPNYSQVVILKRYRIKILKRSAFKFADISLDYNNKESKITDLEGATYNLEANGQIKVFPLDKSDIYKTKDSKKNKNISFTFPAVKEGSVLEYQFTQKIKETFSIPTWYFQNNLPTVLSACRIRRPDHSVLQKRVIGEWPVEEDSSINYSIEKEAKELENIYMMKNVPSFTPEAFMSSSRDYRYRIDFLTVPAGTMYAAIARESKNIWQLANYLLLNHHNFGGQFNADIPGTKKLIESLKKQADVSAKIAAVYKYVKQKVKWNQYYSLLSRDLKQVWEEGEGTSVEINLSILNLLRKCDVTCFPVLYSTRLHGKVDYNFPNLAQFNTVNIAAVNGKKFNLLDGTNPYLSYDIPPYDVVNRTGMLVDIQNHSKINIDFNRKLLWDSVYVYASIDSNGIIHGKIVKKYFDLAKTLKLQSYGEGDEDDERNNSISLNTSEIKADSTYQLDKENELQPLTEVSIFHHKLPSTNNFYFLSPFLFSNLSKNPFTDTTRKTDIDFVANTSSVVHVEITLPKEIIVEEILKDKELRAPDSSVIFIYHNEIKNGTIFINSSFEINKPIFKKSEYADLRRNFKNIFDLLNNPLLLRAIVK